ncbi:hypothetical protein HMPREF0201_04542 [Cedecea davisae DSM 4568]|uniref:Uncharacterized protein n=1 Tax=Cedecea davisae DSM 4568 TaxID=566551 RepID=S3JIA9_9ENTR|nr:hypothetical protein HMPREF0201_04542 [Cedecea davisae DSM 4568]
MIMVSRCNAVFAEQKQRSASLPERRQEENSNPLVNALSLMLFREIIYFLHDILYIQARENSECFVYVAY